MKVINILTISFLFFYYFSFSQIESYKENTWLSCVWKHSLSEKFNLTTDVGYRLFDNFFNKRRQDLARIVIEQRINENHYLGLGVAYFESIILNLNSFNREFRPFVQYQYQSTRGKSKLGFRFRNEFRYYQNSNTYVDRSRLQVSYEYSMIEKYLNPRLAVEGFISTGSARLIEQRYSIGNVFNFSALFKSYLFYTLQLQSNIEYDEKQILQHILGIQIQLNTNKK